MLLDRTTEAIAHFLGLFDPSTEAARLRKAYEEFAPGQEQTEHETLFYAKKVHLEAPLKQGGFDPGVIYHPTAPELTKLMHSGRVEWWPIPTPEARLQLREPDIDPHFNRIPIPGRGGEPIPIEPPGSIVAVVHQQTRLSDDDYASIGAHGLAMARVGDAESALAKLLAAANRLDPLGGLTVADGANTTEELIAFVDQAAAMLRDYADEQVIAPNEAVFSASGAALQNTIRVNGALATEAPDLENYRHKLPEPEEPAQEGVDAVRLKPTDPSYAQSAYGDTLEGPGIYKDPGFVTIEGGSNTLVNTAVIANNSVAGHVMAAMGDYVELDAIIQTNVYSDLDSIGSVISDWSRSGGLSKSFNIAEFTRDDYSAAQAAKTTPGEFPKGWAVATIDGDLTITAWIQQLNFMMDNDVTVASSTGVKSTVTTGDNMQMNYLSLDEIGLYYDLILVGGNIYDANIIVQANILLDDDLISTLPGFSTGGQKSLSNGDNLLWNYANIRNIQGNGLVEALPGAYRDAGDNFAKGSKILPQGVLDDAAFAGLAGLRVLYVKGDFVNVQYVKQTNVLGDPDQVAAAKNLVLKQHDAAWMIKTGGNDVINLASISDVDLTGKAYHGGKAYSDALLVQAELVADKPSFGLGDPAKLVGEAVAFLSDDYGDGGLGKAFHKSDAFSLPSLDHAGFDPMHSMVS